MQHERRYFDRAEVARRWFIEEFTPVVRMLRAADLIGSGTDAEAYMRVASERYRLMRTHEWNDEVIERLRQEVRCSRSRPARPCWWCRPADLAVGIGRRAGRRGAPAHGPVGRRPG